SVYRVSSAPMSRRLIFRFSYLLVAVLQFALPAVASVADAVEETEGRAVRCHVEAYGSQAHRVHPEDCVLCGALSHSASPSTQVALRAPIARIIRARVAAATRLHRAARAAGDPPQRAPPTLS
ncbi:MAG TPA: hypothetical protein VF929_06305, partial [Gemmatimonadaceae bacterium]